MILPAPWNTALTTKVWERNAAVSQESACEDFSSKTAGWQLSECQWWIPWERSFHTRSESCSQLWDTVCWNFYKDCKPSVYGNLETEYFPYLYCNRVLWNSHLVCCKHDPREIMCKYCGFHFLISPLGVIHQQGIAFPWGRLERKYNCDIILKMWPSPKP